MIRILSFTLLVILSSCATKYVKFEQPKNEIHPTPKLLNYIKNTPNPKVVIRTKDVKTKIITGNYSNYSNGYSDSNILGTFDSRNTHGSSQFIEKEINYDNLYDVIERELMKNQFIVRDRQLYNQALINNDYVSKGDTDLIIEISKLNLNVIYETNKYYTDKNKDGRLPYLYKRYGAEIEFKVLMIEENELVGSYTYKYAPCNSKYPCVIDEAFSKNWHKARTGKTGYEKVRENELEVFLEVATQQLVHSLIN